MNPVVLTNLLLLLGLIPVGVLLGWGILRGLDKLIGIKFDDAITRMAEDPKALSIYFSARFIGVMYLVAALTSRFV